jgi:RNase P subunit RPR2
MCLPDRFESDMEHMKKQEYCKKCQKPLTSDEIGATKKLINRGSQVFFCLDCLAQAFDITREDIEKKIVYFKETGCTLFQ